MALPNDPADVGSLIRRRGMPEPPRADEQRSEVRSDAFVGMVAHPATHTTFAPHPVVIQWRYQLTYARSVQFHRFLAENEQFIAESCETVLKVVHYRGTYVGISGQRAAYTTLWGYDSIQAQGEWSRVLRDKGSRFYAAVRDLRSFWTSDPTGMQETFGLAAGVDLMAEGFLAVTVDAEREGPGSRDPEDPG